MELKSLLLGKQSCSLDQLFQVPGKLRAVIAISAYVDCTTINKLIDYVRDCADERAMPILRIFVDRSSSRFFSDAITHKRLLRAGDKIKRMCAEGSGIFLVKVGPLFHSKAYLIDGNARSRLILGSMNLTEKGLFANEELVLSLDMPATGKAAANTLARSLRDYAKELEKNAVKVQRGKSPRFVASLRQMLLDGNACYERKEQSPFRFQLHLPEKAVGLVEAVEIDPLLDASMVDSIALERLIEAKRPNGLEIDLPPAAKEKSQWKKLCVETCYGYWTPSGLSPDFETARKARMQSRLPRFDGALESLEQHMPKILDAFVSFCSRVASKLDGKKIGGWKYENLTDARKAWASWATRIQEKVSNLEYRDRLLSGLDTAPCPDVWGDTISAEEMESSFCKSIVYYWSKSKKGTSNRVAQAIAENLEFDDEKRRSITWHELRTSMVQWMNKNPERDITSQLQDDEI